MYELQAVLVSVRGGDPATLWERWQPSYNIGQEVGIDRGEPLQFGPSNVAIRSVSLPIEMPPGYGATSDQSTSTSKSPVDGSGSP
jgi:hypothetical protein